KKGEVELGALERAAGQIFQQALGNGGRVPHRAYQRKIDELNDTPGVTLALNKKDLENRVQAKLRRHKAEQQREAVGSRESTRSSASGNARPRQRHRPDVGQYRSSGGSRPTMVASDVSPADRPIRRHEQARAPKGSRTRRPRRGAAWLSPQQDNFGLARPTRGQQPLQQWQDPHAKSDDEGEEEDGDGKSVDSFDSDATPPADDDIVLGGDTGDGELEKPLPLDHALHSRSLEDNHILVQTNST
ncbi:hypothetical protein THAOC_11874, partial [Thalassiosira oceanica]